jgi:hypothetical protein
MVKNDNYFAIPDVCSLHDDDDSLVLFLLLFLVSIILVNQAIL